MRTTVELSDRVRAKLLELAARRGDRGFSALVEEALERYVADEERRRQLTESARSVIGAMGDADTRALEESVRRLRGHWR